MFYRAENLNKQFFNFIYEMILSDKRNLEAIVSDNEIEIAIKDLKDKPLTEKVEELETISPVIEQQLDTESYESTSYSIGTEYNGTSTKAYYERMNVDADETTMTASFSCSAYEHEFLQQAQEIASNTREGDKNNHPFVEAQIDANIKYVKDSIKTISPVTWKLMYEGKLTFN